MLVLLGARGVAGAAAPPIPRAEWLVDQVKILSAPEMEGRRAGSTGAERAARHIGQVFSEAGLRPGGDAGTFFQAVEVPTGIRLGALNTLEILAPVTRSLVLGREFVPLAVSADGSLRGDPAVVTGPPGRGSARPT